MGKNANLTYAELDSIYFHCNIKTCVEMMRKTCTKCVEYNKVYNQYLKTIVLI
jgi:hypothetical protein